MTRDGSVVSQWSQATIVHGIGYSLESFSPTGWMIPAIVGGGRTQIASLTPLIVVGGKLGGLEVLRWIGPGGRVPEVEGRRQHGGSIAAHGEPRPIRLRSNAPTTAGVAFGRGGRPLGQVFARQMKILGSVGEEGLRDDSLSAGERVSECASSRHVSSVGIGPAGKRSSPAETRSFSAQVGHRTRSTRRALVPVVLSSRARPKCKTKRILVNVVVESHC